MKDEKTFIHYFDSREEKGKRVIVRDSGAGVPGEFGTRPLEYNKDARMTLVEVTLKTGLRHQIRAQMSHLGHPLIGDVFYGGRSARRLYLHALSYSLLIEGEAYIWSHKPHDFDGL